MMTQQHDAPEGGALTLELMADRLTQYLHNDVADGTPIADIAHDAVSHMLTGKYGGPSRRAAVADILNRFSATPSTPIKSVALSPDYIMKSMMAGSAAAPTPPAPSGLVDAVRAYREAVEEWIASRWRSETPAGGMEAAWDAMAAASLALDATLSGQQGGAVPAGDLRVQGADGQIESAITAGLDADQKAQPEWAWISYGDDLKVTWGRWRKHPGQAPYIRGDIVAAAINRARLAEQPAPAGTGDADPATLYARRVTIPDTKAG